MKADRSIVAYSDSERVERYDADMDLMHPNRHKMAEIILEVVPFGSGDAFHVLDLGAGTGFLTWTLLQRYPRVTVLGVDGSEAMIELARSRLADAGERVRLVTTRFEEIEAAVAGDEQFHLVLSSYALHHLDHRAKRRLLEFSVDRLAPKGWFLNADLVASPHSEIEAIIQDLRARGIVTRSGGSDPRFTSVERAKVFLDDLEAMEEDQPLSMEEDLRLIRACGIPNASVFWQEYREIVYGGFRTAD